MKKLFSLGLLSVCALALAEQQASAWCNAKFSVGLNWHMQSANNNFLWGFWKNGQVPGPEAFGQPGGGGPPVFGPMQGHPQGQFPWFGNNPGMPQGVPVDTNQPPVSTQQQQAYNAMMQNYYNPYTTVSYQPSAYYNYQPSAYYPNYYTPSYYQGYGYQAPYYWYQGR